MSISVAVPVSDFASVIVYVWDMILRTVLLASWEFFNLLGI